MTGRPGSQTRSATASSRWQRAGILADAVVDALGELERDLNLGHQLSGRLTGLRSYRVGASRTIDELRDDTSVRVVAIRHRGDAHGRDPR